LKAKNSPLFMVFVLALLAIGNWANSATITWTNTSGGNWSATNNWSPNQLPTNTDNVLIKTPGTYTLYLDVPGVVTNLTLGAGGGAAGVQTFVATNLLTVNSLLLVTGGGVLNSSGDYAGLAGAMTVANGGVFNLAAGYYHFDSALNPLVVTNGGTVNANGQPLLGSGFGYYYGSTFGSVIVANGGVLNVTNGAQAGGACNVTPGGVLNVSAAGLTSYGPVNNSGIINLTNGTISLINNGYQGGAGGLVNQAGGLINLQGSGSINSSSGLPGYEQYYYGYVTNQGTMTQIAGTNSISCPFYDNSQGTITNLSGVLSLGLFQNNLAGTYFTAAGATVQFMGADIPNYNAAPQLTLGTPFVLGGSGQYQLTSGYLYLPSNVPTNLVLMGDTLQLGPGFQGGAITNLTLEGIQLLNALPVTGTLTATNSEIATNLVVANGGVFNLNGIFVKGTTTIAHGGTINVQSEFTLVYSLTNSGTLNLTAPIAYNGPATGILNQPGGLINLGSNASITIATPTNFFINQGTIVQNAGADATNTISYQKAALVYIATNLSDEISIYLPFDFDTSQGIITNLSGTLVLPSFPSSLAGTFYAATGATIQLGGGTTNAPLVSGTPLVLGGSGQYQFISGYLNFPTVTIPNLSLQAGLLTLGAGFQGGAITNLVLDGITLSNQPPATLPINGTFTAMNSGSAGTLNNGAYVGFYGSGVHGNYSVASGGVLNVSNAVMYGTVTVANGGVLNAASSSILYGNLTVSGGGVLNSSFNATFYAVTVASNGLFNSLDSFFPYVGGFGQSSTINGPLTNFGTIIMTNSGIGFYNDGTTNFHGCLRNQTGGLIDFRGNTGIGGYGGYAYLDNQGRILKSAGSSFSGFGINFATNSGTITAQTGPMVLGGSQQWTLLPSSTLNVVLNSANNYGNFIFSASGPINITGNAALAGTFNATLNNGYVPTNGTTFNVLSYGSFTGSFSSLGLPAAVSWQSNYGSTNFTLVAGSGLPQFGIVNLSGTNLVFNGTGGTAGSNYVMLESTNLALPLTNWTALATNIFDGSGQFHYTNHVSPVKPRQFFIFKLP
jgi:hypothetical protein